jgi:NAD(P)H-dependent FMN reductase
MADSPTVLAFAGSTRKASFNKRLVRVAARAAEDTGAAVTVIDLADFPMPHYDGDLEEAEGLPEHAKRFKRLLIEHDGFLIASPEYNGSLPAVLKNAIDWASRPEPDEPRLAAFRGKHAGLMAASPGRLGGLRALMHLRTVLQDIGVRTLPEIVATPGAADAFTDDGDLKDEQQREMIRGLGARLVESIRRLDG